MLELGLIQGRLTPSHGRGIQFPLLDRAEWEREFELAPQAGISSIEWVCDSKTPLFEKETREAVCEAATRTKIAVRNMDLHETTTKQDVAFLSDELFERICSSVQAVNGGAVEVPLVEASSLLDSARYALRVEALKRLIVVAQKYSLAVGVETDLPAKELALLLEKIPEISVVYDTGNSAGLGYDMEEEIGAYGARISNVHIKDKPVGGSTVPLGEGSVDFTKLFSLLKKFAYRGAVTLQVARGEDGKEVETIKKYTSFIQDAYAKSF